MTFKAGQSGNPGGRPKESPEVKELARKYTAEAVETLAKHMRGDDVRASVAASQALLDRGYGKPSQAVEVSGNEGGPIEQSLVVSFVEKNAT